MPAPLAPMTATVSPSRPSSDDRTAPGSRRRTHRAPRRREQGSESAPSHVDLAHLRASDHACGSPSAMKRADVQRHRRSTTATSACTMCSIQTIDTPPRVMSLDEVDQGVHSRSVRPPAISSSRSTRGWSQAPGRVRAACGRAASRLPASGWLSRRGRNVRACPMQPSYTSRSRRPRAEDGADDQIFEYLMPPKGGVSGTSGRCPWCSARGGSRVMSRPAKARGRHPAPRCR